MIETDKTAVGYEVRATLRDPGDGSVHEPHQSGSGSSLSARAPSSSLTTR